MTLFFSQFDNSINKFFFGLFQQRKAPVYFKFYILGLNEDDNSIYLREKFIKNIYISFWMP